MNLKELQSRTNIHDYLEKIGAEPPPVDAEELAKAKASVIWVNSIEEAVEAIVKMDKESKP